MTAYMASITMTEPETSLSWPLAYLQTAMSASFSSVLQLPNYFANLKHTSFRVSFELLLDIRRRL